MAQDQSKYTLQMTRKGVVVSVALIFFVMGWMFVLGILVGRGTTPVPIKTHDLEKELNDLKSAMLNKAGNGTEAKAGQDQPRTTDLGFYEALKKAPPKESYKAGSPSAAVRKAVEPAVAPRKKAVAAADTPVHAPAKPAPAEKKDKTAPPPAKAEQAARQAPASAGAPVQEGRFSIQVGAYRDLQSAEQMVAKLRGKHYPGYSLRADVKGKGTWFRVRVGAFESRAAAENMLKRLENERFKGIVVGSR